METITQILTCRVSVSVYWMLLVLHRLLESKSNRVQCREILLSSSSFQQKLLSLFDEDTLVRMPRFTPHSIDHAFN